MSDASLISDADLPFVRLAQSGDLEAFDELVKRHQTLMTGLLYRFAPQRADLEDMVQETFLRAWKGLGAWTPARPFVHWLKRIAVHVGLEFCRRESRSPLSRLAVGNDDSASLLENISDENVTLENALHSLEEAQFLLAQLPPEDRALLTLVHLQEMPLTEVAEHFGWSRANAKIKAFRARHRLRKLLSRHGYQFE